MRRDPRTVDYCGTICPDIVMDKMCPRGGKCPFSHNTFETWLHTMRYRTRLCRQGRRCNRRRCFFAHGQDQLRKPSIAPIIPLDSSFAPSSCPSDMTEHPHIVNAIKVQSSGSGHCCPTDPHKFKDCHLPYDMRLGIQVCQTNLPNLHMGQASDTSLPWPEMSTLLGQIPTGCPTLDPAQNFQLIQKPVQPHCLELSDRYVCPNAMGPCAMQMSWLSPITPCALQTQSLTDTANPVQSAYQQANLTNDLLALLVDIVTLRG